MLASYECYKKVVLENLRKRVFYFEEFDAHLGKSFSFFPFLYCTNIPITCTAFQQRKFMNEKLFHALIFIFNDSQFSGVFIITHNIQNEIETEMSENSFFEEAVIWSWRVVLREEVNWILGSCEFHLFFVIQKRSLDYNWNFPSP